MSFNILVSSTANDIYHLTFIPPSDTSRGVLSTVNTSRLTSSSAWLTPHPRDPNVLFTCFRTIPEGQIIALRYSGIDKRLDVVGHGMTGGGGGPSVVAAGSELFVAEYSTSIVSTLSFEDTPREIRFSAPRVHNLEGSGPNAERQTHPHPHEVVLHPSREELLVPDLGSDKTWRFLKSPQDGTWMLRGSVDYAPGQGPRHIVVHGDFLYTLHELSNEITVHLLPEMPKPSVLLSSIASMAFAPDRPHYSIAAEILLTRKVPEPYILVSNRADDPPPSGDVISVYRVIEGGAQLQKIQEVSSGLQHLRAMMLFGDEDRWVMAGGANGGGVRVFDRRNDMTVVAEDQTIEGPISFLCMEPRIPIDC